MGRRDSKGPPAKYPKAMEIKSAVDRDAERDRLRFKEPTDAYDASAALKLNDEQAATDLKSKNQRKNSFFDSLLNGKSKNSLAVVEVKPPAADDRAAIGSSYGHPRVDPTLSPSAVGRLKKESKRNHSRDSLRAEAERLKPLDPGQGANPSRRSRTKTDPLSQPFGQTRVTKVQVTSAEDRATKARRQGLLDDKAAAEALIRSQAGGVDVESESTESGSRTQNVALLLLLLLGAAGLYFFLQSDIGPGASKHRSAFSQQEQEQMVRMHRFETGADLNNGRVKAEYENYRTAPVLPLTAHRQKGPSMMDGVPLEQEPNLRTNARDRLEAANPNDPDHRVEYILQDEQDANEWEDKAQHAYVKEFVQNAREAGLQVRVRDNMDVEVKPLPPSERPDSQRGSGHASH